MGETSVFESRKVKFSLLAGLPVFIILIGFLVFSAWFRAWLAVNFLFYFSFLVFLLFPAFTFSRQSVFSEKQSLSVLFITVTLIGLHFAVYNQPNIWKIILAIYRGEYFMIPALEFLQGLPAWAGIVLIVHHTAHAIPEVPELLMKDQPENTENKSMNLGEVSPENSNLLRKFLFCTFLLFYVPVVYTLLERFFGRGTV